MNSVTAAKGNQKKQFTELAWENIGGDKNTIGWKRVIEPSQTVSNQVTTEPPPTGDKIEKPKIVDNRSVKNEVVDKPEEPSQTVSNQVNEESSTENSQEQETEVQGEAKEFMELASKIERRKIRDFLDIQKVEYKQNATIDTLHKLLETQLHGSVDLLKAEFSLS